MDVLRRRILPLAAGYLLGSLPSARWIGALHGVDPTQEGDRNPGSWNVTDLAGFRAGAAVWLLDNGKGAVATAAGRLLGGPRAGAAAGAAAIAGHAWPPWTLGRGGGQGLTVLLGSEAVLSPATTVGGYLTFVFLIPVTGVGRAVTTGMVASLLLISLDPAPSRRRDLLALHALFGLRLLQVTITRRASPTAPA